MFLKKMVNIIYSKGNAYRVIFAFMDLNDAINLMNSSGLNNKRGAL